MLSRGRAVRRVRVYLKVYNTQIGNSKKTRCGVLAGFIEIPEAIHIQEKTNPYGRRKKPKQDKTGKTYIQLKAVTRVSKFC